MKQYPLCAIQAFVNMYAPVQNVADEYVVFTSLWEFAYTAGVMASCIACVRYFVR